MSTHQEQIHLKTEKPPEPQTWSNCFIKRTEKTVCGAQVIQIKSWIVGMMMNALTLPFYIGSYFYEDTQLNFGDLTFHY